MSRLEKMLKVARTFLERREVFFSKEAPTQATGDGVLVPDISIRRATRLRFSGINLALTLTVMPLSAALNTSADGVDVLVVEGLLKAQFFGGNGKLISQNSSTNRFRAIIGLDGQWRLEVRRCYAVNHIMRDRKDVSYMSFDGADTFYVEFTEAVTELKKGQPTVVSTSRLEDHSNLAYICSGNYPYAPYDFQKRLHVLWLTFGAGTYLYKNQPRSLPLPWVAARWSLDAFGFGVDSELSAAAPHIPKKIRLFRDVRLDFANENSEWARPDLDKPSGESWVQKWREELKSRKDEWPDGFTAGLLEARQFTNSGVFQIPLEFVLTTYLPYLGSTDKVRWKYEGQITNVGHVANFKAFRPPIEAPVTVLDTRFRSREAGRQLDRITYSLASQEDWMATNSARLQEIFKSDLSIQRLTHVYQPSFWSKQRIVLLIMVLVGVGIPCLLRWFRVRTIKSSSSN